MDELLRYLWLHGTERAASELLVYTILFIVAVGCVIRSRLLVVRDIDGLVAAIVVAVIANVLLLLSALIPTSPLLGATGRLFPSPWSHGLFQSLCIECIVVCFVFGIVSGTLHSKRDILELITYGIVRWPWAILLAMIVSFFINL
ncbi:MAG: AbgT family transporter [Bacteroidaceae bacterium]|jgi:p-aminobenzoyl-glutamate transporter AbgT|nr:AbgT family transporter [Bacteroidaceae bacterium]